MCSFDFESLFDRVSAANTSAQFHVVARGSGDEGTGLVAPVPEEGVEAAGHTPAEQGNAASTPEPTDYRPVAFGASTVDSGSAAWPVQVTCAECRIGLHLDIVGYQQMVRRLTAQGWPYAIRPVKAAWCPDCRFPEGEHRGPTERGLPTAREVGRARQDRTPMPATESVLGTPVQRRMAAA